MQTKTPRLTQAAILLAASGLTTMITATVGPSLPKMERYFESVPHADYLVPLTVTTPMLVMAIFSIFAGMIADRIGRKRLLLWGTALYALCGTLPALLNNLTAIVGSRIVIGVADAAVMTCSLTMIGDYWQGVQRQKYLALQTTVASGSAVLLGLLGGQLGELGWRAPYWLYAGSLILIPLIASKLWEPIVRDPSETLHHHAGVELPSATTFRPQLLIGICALAVIGGVSFLMVPLHLGYLMNALGIDSSAATGNAQALNSVGVVCGTLTYGWLVGPKLRIPQQLSLCASITAIGFVWIEMANNYALLTAAVTVNGFGCGLLLPTLVTWNMRELPATHRGVGTGAFTSCLFLGMFINPIITVSAATQLGSRAMAIGLLGYFLLALSGVAIIGAMLGKRHRLSQVN